MHDDEPERPRLERIPTGIRGMDIVMGGGFLSGSVQLLMGTPGSGKTIFANQVAFRRAAAGHTAAYVTLLAESHARMLAHLAPFSFFDPNFVSRRILYMSGYGVLEQGGLDGLLDLLTRTIRDHNASLLVIDGLSTAKEFAPTTTAFKRFLLSLSTSASLTGCTTLLMSTIDRLANAAPENATVDGIIRLNKRKKGAWVVRELVVEKMRATQYALGPHAVDIDTHGIHLYPRIESLPEVQLVSREKERSINFGIPGLDAMLGGGVVQGSTTVILGGPGTGKTLLGMTFLMTGTKDRERGIYLGFREPSEQVERAAAGIGLDVPSAVARDLLVMHWLHPKERSIDAIAWQLLEEIDRTGTKRLFIDGLYGFHVMATFTDRLERFHTALARMIAKRGTTIVTAEVATVSTSAEDMIRSVPAVFLDNVLILRRVKKREKVRRCIEVPKVQAAAHELSTRRLRISNKGLSVEQPLLRKFREDKP